MRTNKYSAPCAARSRSCRRSSACRRRSRRSHFAPRRSISGTLDQWYGWSVGCPAASTTCPFRQNVSSMSPRTRIFHLSAAAAPLIWPSTHWQSPLPAAAVADHVATAAAAVAASRWVVNGALNSITIWPSSTVAVWTPRAGIAVMRVRAGTHASNSTRRRNAAAYVSASAPSIQMLQSTSDGASASNSGSPARAMLAAAPPVSVRVR